MVSLEAAPARGAPRARIPWWRRWQTALLGAFLLVTLVVLVALEAARRGQTATLWVAASVLVLSLAMALFGWLAARFNEMAGRLAETTQRLHLALDAARADRRRLATTLESIPDGVLVCDAEGRLVLANEPARRMLGDRFASGAVLADVGSGPETRTLGGEPVPPDERPLRRALAGEAVHDLRLAVHGPEGQVRYVSATAAPVESGAGERLGAVAVLRDVTDQQALDTLKSQFIARASHELRTPLTVIRGTLGFLRRSTGRRLGRSGTELLAMASRNADQMLRLVEDLLDASRLTRGVLRFGREQLDAGDLLAQAVRLVAPEAAGAGVQIDLDVEAGLVLEADPPKLEQVLANLLGNAIRSTAQHGRVAVTAARAGDAVEIRVADQGRGLAREHLEMVFEPFFQVDQTPAVRTRRPQGSGLGLTIARSLVELHGGRIWAESGGRGRGSTFVVRLPAARDLPASQKGVGFTS